MQRKKTILNNEKANDINNNKNINELINDIFNSNEKKDINNNINNNKLEEKKNETYEINTNQNNPIFNFDKFDFSKLQRKPIPLNKIENNITDIKKDKNNINDINDIFNIGQNTNIENNNNLNNNFNFTNYIPNENIKIEKENNYIEEKVSLNYSLSGVFIIDENKDSNELNINQLGLNENNPYDSL